MSAADLAQALGELCAAICHQLPDRTPSVLGARMLCYRCTGIYGGLALGLLAAGLGRGAVTRGAFRLAFGAVLLSATLVALDARWLQARAPQNPRRLATGLVLGGSLGLFAGQAVRVLRQRPLEDGPGLNHPGERGST
jgi:uncharacterized membrane protein